MCIVKRSTAGVFMVTFQSIEAKKRMSGIKEWLKGHGQESPLDFLAILKVLYVKQKKIVQSVEKPSMSLSLVHATTYNIDITT